MASGCVRTLGCFSLLLFVLAVCLSASATNLEDERLDRYERQAIETPSTPLPPKTTSAGGNLKTENQKRNNKKNKTVEVTSGVTSAAGAYGISMGTAAINILLGITTQVPSVKTTATTAEGNQGIAAVPQPPPCQPVTNPGLGTNFNLSFVPSVLYINEGDVQNVTIVYSGLVSPRAMLVKSSDEAMFVVVSNDTFFMEPIGNNDNVTLTVTLQGTHLGVTYLQILILDPIRYDTDDAEVFTYLVKTKRIPRFIDTLFNYMLLPLILIVTCGMGCKLDLDIIKMKLRRPIPVLVGPVCQFICMPLVALCISKLLEFDPLTAMGLITVGSCPGGGLSNMITLLVDADLIMSVTMTFASTCLALGMLPLNLFIYGRFFTPKGAEEAGINLPIGKIFLQISFLTIPLLVGMLIRYKLPKVAYYVIKSLNVLSVTLIVLTLGVGVYSNVYIIYSPGLVLLGGFLHPTVGFIIGFIMAKYDLN